MGILEVSHLSMSFAEKQLYTDAEFSLNKEDHLGVIGQNGAGKSTLIKSNSFFLMKVKLNGKKESRSVTWTSTLSRRMI